MPRSRAWSRGSLPGLRAAVLALSEPDADEAPERALLELAGRFPGVGRGLVELMAHDPSRRVHEQAALLVYFAARFAEPRLRERVLGTAAQDLIAAMHDPLIPDDRKYAMVPLLEPLGRGLADDEKSACFHDFEGTAERSTRESMTNLLDVPEQVEALLSFSVLAPGAEVTEGELISALETAVETLLQNAQVGSVLATVLVAICREKGLATEPALAALDLVARTKTPRAAWYVGELASWPAAGEIGDRARSLRADLEAFPVRPQPTGPFSHGFVAPPDAEGARDVVLLYRTSEGTLDGLALLLSERLGIQDAFATFGDGSDLEAQARRQFGSWAPCDPAFARELVADALAVHERTGRPVPGRFLLYRPFLGDAPIAASARKPQLGAYALETIVPGPELAAGSAQLVDHEVYGELGSTSDAAYAFAASRRGARRRNKLDDFVHEVVAAERHVLLARLAAALEVEARAGRAKRPENRLAARTYLSIETEAALDRIPYVRALSRRALHAVERNVKKGYRSQAEASAAVASR